MLQSLPMMELNDLSRAIIGCALRVHTRLGPGLFESVYETLLADELRVEAMPVETQKSIRMIVGTRIFHKGFKIDMLVDSRVIVELKSQGSITRLDVKQMLTYLRLMDLRLGLILNFGRESLEIKRIVNQFRD